MSTTQTGENSTTTTKTEVSQSKIGYMTQAKHLQKE